MKRIRWTQPAARGLTAICDYIKEHDAGEPLLVAVQQSPLDFSQTQEGTGARSLGQTRLNCCLLLFKLLTKFGAGRTQYRGIWADSQNCYSERDVDNHIAPFGLIAAPRDHR
jgi:hypothetical protein